MLLNVDKMEILMFGKSNGFEVIITDKKGTNFPCEPESISIVDVITDSDCNGEDLGAIDISVSGGVGGYTYDWQPSGQTDHKAEELPAGNHTVTVTDANGCVDTININLTSLSSITMSVSVIDESCCGAADGAIIVTANGGTPPYQYVWSTGQTTHSITPSTGGSYSVVVTDANGCVFI